MSGRLNTASPRPTIAAAVTMIVALALALSVLVSAAPQARAADLYTIGGAVTVPSGYTVADLEWSTVRIENTVTGAIILGSFDGNTNRWRAANVPAGTYTIQFKPSSSSPLSEEYYNNKITKAEATVVTVNGDRADLNFHLELKIPRPTSSPDIYHGDKIAGFIKVGDTIRVVNPTYSGFTPSTITYQWLRDGQPIPGATAQQYTLQVADHGKYISVLVRVTKSGYTPAEYLEKHIFDIRPGTITPATPTMTGTPRVGQTLTAVTGSWNPVPNFTYQWLSGGTPVSGATGAMYVVRPQDLGTNVAVRVYGNLTGYAQAWSQATSVPVLPGLFTSSPNPTLAAVPRVGTAVTANLGLWTPAPDSVAYQWLRNGTAIPGATAATYTPVYADLNQNLAVRVTVSKNGYEGLERTSQSVKTQQGLFNVVKAPSISGPAKPGAVLTANPGNWGTTPDVFNYQWLRDGQVIPGAQSATFTLPDDARGHQFQVTVWAGKSGYVAESRTSAPLHVLQLFTKTPAPTISGTGAGGQKLTAKPGAWDPAPDAFTYQWYRNGKAISGAKSATYKLVAADSGKTITVKVTGKKSGFKAVAKTSAKKVLKKFFTKSPAPKISGTGKVGKTLTAKVGTWSPKPTKFTYQWYRDGKAISKATKSTYKLKAADAGKKITVKVTAKRSGYASTPKTSAAKSVALQTFTKAPVPKIKGTASVGATLTVTTGTWSPKPAFTYQWYRGGVAIVGATAKTYVLTEADAGAKITVKVTGKKTGYKTKSVTSAAVTAKAPL